MSEMIAQFWADIELYRNIASWVCFLFGGLAVVAGALGIVRFPDFYTRLHAAGVTDTGGAEMLLIGMLLQAPTWIVAMKIFFIGAFLFFTSPVATHAIAHSAWMVGFRPLEGPELKYKESSE